MTKLYVLTDIDITLTLSGYVVADIIQMAVTLTQGDTVKTYTKAAGDITLGVTNAVLRIPRTSITAKGNYEVRITFADVSGNVRGLNTNPEWVIFY